MASDRPGFSGTGYVRDFGPADARAAWEFEAKAGLYTVRLGFATPGGQKGFVLSVNGAKQDGMFPATDGAFSALDFGLVELEQGANRIALERGWGFFELDFVEFAPAAPPKRPASVPPTLTDPKASPEARALMKYLATNYGKATLSGQFDLGEANYIRKTTGEFPAILGTDLMDYSPSRVEFNSKPRNLTETMVKLGAKGDLITITWHWNAPTGLLNKRFTRSDGKQVDASWYRGFYTEATTFDLAKALDTGNEEYKLLLRDVDAIAIELKKYQAAHVPVLWRPLHEAEGGWFWWGAKGPGPAIALWRLLRERLIEYHALHNLIWVWNSAKPEWYPGDDQVDIMSIDAYPSDRSDPLSNAWQSLLERFDGKKLIALAEFPGVPDVDRMAKFGTRFSYFTSWTGGLGPRSEPAERLSAVYRSSRVVTRDELPNLRSK